MRRLILAGGLAAAVTAGGLIVWRLAPSYAEDALRERGVAVGSIGWCKGVPWTAPAMCARDLARDGIRVGAARVDASREVRLEGVRVPWDAARRLLQDGAPTGDVGGSRARLRPARVLVQDLQVEGAPVPLPAVSGEAWPSPSLRGEGLRVDGRTVEIELATEWGSVQVRARPAGDDAAEVSLVAPQLQVSLPSLDEVPLRWTDVRGEGRVELRAQRFTGTARVGAVAASVEARLEGDVVVADLRLPSTEAAALYRAFASVVPELDRARIAGSVSARARLRWPGGVEEIVPEVHGLSVHGLVDPAYARGTFGFMGKDATGAPVYVQTGDGMPGWTPLARMGAWLPAAVIAAEDGAFRGHPGYDVEGMLAAADENEVAGRIRRGGSTLTQQLAKNLFLDGRRTYARKLRELLYAVDLENLGKDRILELYLNVAEWGPGVRGAAAAAETYFARRPETLLPEEAAWLASILPSPRPAWRQQYLANAPRMERVATILSRMSALDEVGRSAALARPIRFVPPVATALP